jgi:hypothetical protein
VVVLLAALAALLASTWRAGQAPDLRGGEVAAAQAVGAPGLAVPDPRVGPVSPLHALAVRGWVDLAGGATHDLVATVRTVRVPSALLFAVAAALTAILCLLLPGRRQLAAAAVAGVLAALDPALVATGRLATGEALGLALALAALALAWALPERPARRLVVVAGAAGGLALLGSLLALPTLLVPVVAARLERWRRRERLDLALLGAAGLVWLALPAWAAGQGLGDRLGAVLLGRAAGRGTLSVPPASLALAAGGLLAAVWLGRRHPAGPRLLAWVMVTLGGALLAALLGWPAAPALAFAQPAAAAAVAVAVGHAVATLAGRAGPVPSPAVGRWSLLGVAVVAVLLAGQVADLAGRYRGRDDALERLATVAGGLGGCQAVNSTGADARARLLAEGVPVTGYGNGPAAAASGVRYYVLGPKQDGPAAWVQARGRLLTDLPSGSFRRVQLWRTDPGPFDPVADNLPVPGGVFSNVSGSACGGYAVVDGGAGAFHAAYQNLGGKAVVGRPLSSVWTSDGPALQAFDTLELGSSPGPGGQPRIRPVDLLLLVETVHPEALAEANLPGHTVAPPTTDTGVRALLGDHAIARTWLGVDPAKAAAADLQRARDRWGRPVGPPRKMGDGVVRQAFERVVIERSGKGARLAPLGRVAVRAGLVPDEARRLQPVPGLAGQPSATRVDAAAFLATVAGALLLLGLGAAAVALRRRHARPRAGQAPPQRPATLDHAQQAR